MRATPESPRMFKSDFVDGFSRTPWWVVPAVWLPISLGILLLGVTVFDAPLLGGVPLFALGWLIWTFAEYSLHRTAFHWIPATSWGPRFHFMVHGVHHDWVFDKYRLVMPPAVSLILSVIFGTLFWLIFGATWFWPAFSGFLFGYMVYDVVHYATHHSKIKNGAFLALKKHHLLHHHSPRHQDRKYGVSTTLWDHIFRTW
jgi:4-hydroxysphinganine ceramide fatty acyl 2-hydroxylase